MAFYGQTLGQAQAHSQVCSLLLSCGVGMPRMWEDVQGLAVLGAGVSCPAPGCYGGEKAMSPLGLLPVRSRERAWLCGWGGRTPSRGGLPHWIPSAPRSSRSRSGLPLARPPARSESV